MNVLILRTIILLLAAACSAQAGVRSLMSSKFLARGEEVVFEIRVEGQEADELPRIPEIKGVTVEAIGFGRPRIFPGRRVESSFQYVVSSYAVGRHEIPPVEVMVNGKKMITEPVAFEVFDPGDLKWNEAVPKPAVDGEVIKYASIIRVPDRKYFVNQSMEVEIKIYVPLAVARSVVDWGIPQFERKGLAVWRFEPSESRGQVNLLGQPYVTLSYPTTMTALDSGDVEIGPATVRLTYQKVVFDGYTRQIEIQATLDVPTLTFPITPLPEGAPEGYDNAVGNFTIGTAIKQTAVTEGEPLAVDVVVSGSGNLDNLRSPKLTDDKGWKVYDATPTQRGEERREISGTVVFSQFIRPLEMKTGIPPFKLVFFNPETEKYETVTTETIALQMTPATGGRNFESSGPPQAAAVPVERMTDILGLIDTAKLTNGAKNGLPWWLGHAIAAVVSLILVFRVLWLRFGHLFEKDPDKVRIREDFQKVSKAASGDGLDFLRAAGGFVEEWLSSKKDTNLSSILEERDELCFRRDKEGVTVPPSRRQEILRSLRQAAFALALIAVAGFSIPQVQAASLQEEAKAAYDSAKYEDAAKLWLEAGPYENLAADTLYNIGNAAYRMGAPGQAALYYRRALAVDKGHGEARQNLRFIERKYGSISIVRPAYQYSLAKVPLSVWRGGLWCGLWMLVIALLIFPATRPGSKWRVAGVVGFVAGPLLVSLGALGWRHYPDDAEFAPLAKQAVIVSPKAVLHADAARTSPEVIDAPQGSVAEVLQRSGRWAYVGFATKTRGWVLLESMEMVVPTEKPEPPKVKKTEGDGSSA